MPEERSELMDEVLHEASARAGAIPVNMGNPTFGSLLTLLRAVRQGQAGDKELETYDRALTFKLQLARRQLNEFEMPEALRLLAGPALAMVAGLMGGMDEVLSLLREYRASHQPAMLDQAEVRLQSVHATLQQAMALFAPLLPKPGPG